MIRIARALYALTGGGETWIKRFMHTPNKITGGIPAKQIAQLEGLICVLRFVDAIRGKVHECDGNHHIKRLTGTLYRLVECQEQVATLGYVDTLEEQAMLEEVKMPSIVLYLYTQ